MNTHSFLNISPAFLAIVGLILFISGQFLKNGFKIFFSITGLLFIGGFFYKLLMIETESQLAYSYADRGNFSYHLPWGSIYFLVIGMNALGLICWLSTILRATFSDVIPKPSQMTILFSGLIVLVLNLIVFKLFGYFVGAVCFPITTIAFFVGFNRFYKRIKTESALRAHQLQQC